jgi:hypothetical protein
MARKNFRKRGKGIMLKHDASCNERGMEFNWE